MKPSAKVLGSVASAANNNNDPVLSLIFLIPHLGKSYLVRLVSFEEHGQKPGSFLFCEPPHVSIHCLFLCK